MPCPLPVAPALGEGFFCLSEDNRYMIYFKVLCLPVEVCIFNCRIMYLYFAETDTAVSLKEGFDEPVTVQHLAISGLLSKNLSTTNPIESAFNIVCNQTGNLKHWQKNKMVQRWVAAGLLEAESRFRRIKGYWDIVLLKTKSDA